MKIKDLGGEFALLEKLIGCADSTGGLSLPNGDDAAVFDAAGNAVAISTDSIVQDVHFSLNYYTYKQIGMKAIHASVSDIIAVGAKPHSFLVALCLPPDTHSQAVEEIYCGIRAAAQELGIVMIGGDTSAIGSSLVINITAIGLVSAPALSRGGAKPGDKIYVSGALGGSEAGFRLLQKGMSGFSTLKRKHLEPRCRFDLLGQLQELSPSALIDISDGLAIDLGHILDSSKTGAIIDQNKLPILEGVQAAAQVLAIDPFVIALGSGEEFELLFTSSNNPKFGIEIGEIRSEPGLFIRNESGQVILAPQFGYTHFS